jgi:pyruvate formate-lyase activating enzyme-like uncharacterized protein
MIEKTNYSSWRINNLPDGCRMCVQGKKTVLFITGICSKHCFYCPISDDKWQKDFVYANEWKIEDFNDLVTEIKLCTSTGVGITGGDPLTRIERVCEYIQKLKQIFGKGFHIHLYTPLDLVDESKLKMLNDAGLDEIRFNPDLEEAKESTWQRILLAKRYSWKVGVEIPVIPGYEEITKKLIDYINNKIDFLNLNELELSDTNCSELGKMGFVAKDDLSYAAKGSQDMAMMLLEHIKEKGTKMNVHYCTASLKDNVQLRNRIKLRAKNSATKYDKVTEDGTLVKTALYLEELKPEFKYEEKMRGLKSEDKERILKKLKEINNKLQGILDENRLRIIIRKDMIKKASKMQGICIAEVEEYPTHDAMLVSVDFVKE